VAQAAQSAGHPRELAPPHRAGAAAPGTTAASVIDVVLPLRLSPEARGSVAALARRALAGDQRRARLRAAAPGLSKAGQVTAWARQQGIAVTSVTPWAVALHGRADRLARAFGTSLRGERLDGKAFVVPRSAPALPRALREAAAGVVGLDTRPVWKGRTDFGGGDVQVQTSTPVRGSTAGEGATVATVNLSGWHGGDLSTYRAAAFGSSFVAPPTTSVLVGTGAHSGATVLEDDSGDSTEVALDAEAIAGVAPRARQRMYFASNSTAGYLGILNRMVADLTDADATNDFQAASSSWGACELDLDVSTVSQMADAIAFVSAAGATFFASSGDDGAFGCGDGVTPAVDFPASAREAVAVGGTRVDGAAPSYTHNGWTGSGGGCSQRQGAPARQSTSGSPCSLRSVPDIANLADPATGYWVFDRVNQWIPIGGTSLAAPASAAGLATAMAHAGLSALPSSFLDTAYAHPSAFTDVTAGQNGLYRSRVGYDLVTGLGVPRWTALEAAITGAPEPTPSGTNEPVLIANPSSSTTAELGTRRSNGTLRPGIVPNGLPVTGYAASGTSPSTCSANVTATAPANVVLPSGDGAKTVSVSVGVTGGGCVTVNRRVVLDTHKPGAGLPVATYFGTTSPAYRFSWPGATDTSPSSGILFYAVFVTDTTTGQDVAEFYTVGRAFPYSTAGPFKAVAGHGYVVEVDAVDGAGNAGYRTLSFRAPYDDSKASLSKHLSGSTYVSDWTRTKASADYLGSHLASNRKGAWFGLTFTGKTLTAGVLKSRYGGYADVYVDGVRKVRLNLYRSSTAYRQQIRLATFTASGTHKVVVKVVGAHQSGGLGSYVFLDSLAVA
jgi:kumamolisin